jgi:hypothetical protein
MSTTWGPTDSTITGTDYSDTWTTEAPNIGNLSGVVLHAGLSFLYTGATIKKADTINSMYLHGTVNATTQLKIAIRVQSGNWASWGAGNKPHDAAWGVTNSIVDTLFDPYQVSCFGLGELREINLAADLAAAIDADAGDQLENGDYINVCIFSGEDTSDVYTRFNSMAAMTLTIEWTAAAGGVAFTGEVASVSSTPSLLPYITHILIDNKVESVSSTPTLLPYIYHYLINNVVAGVSSLPTLLPYIYHYLINNVVAGASSLYGNLTVILAQIIQELAGVVDAISNLPSQLPYIYHYLVDNVIAGVSSIPSILPYISHRLLPDTIEIVSSLVASLDIILGPVYQFFAGTIDGVSSLVGNLERWGLQFFSGAITGISDLFANLIRIPGALNKLRIYMKIHRGRF